MTPISKVYIYATCPGKIYKDFYFEIKRDMKVRDFFIKFVKKMISKIKDKKDKKVIKKMIEIDYEYWIKEYSEDKLQWMKDDIKKLKDNKLTYIELMGNHDSFLYIKKINNSEYEMIMDG